MHHFKILNIIWLLLWSSFFVAQNIHTFSTETITQDDGLSQGSNYFRFEDRHGFMWITGNDALNRFDGNNIKVYNLNYFFKNCAALQQGYGFAEDQKNLYVGSIRGLYQYDYVKDEFTLIPIFKNSKTKTAIPIDFADGKIWCYNEDYELATYNVTTKKVELVAKLPIDPMISLHVYGSDGAVFYTKLPFFDNKGDLWFFGRYEIVIYHKKTGKSTLFYKNLNEPVYSSFYDREKNLLYVGTSGKFISFNLNNSTKTETTEIGGEKLNFVANIAKYQNIMTIKINYKLILINELQKTSFVFNNYQRANSIEFDKIGRLWFCNDGVGQVIINFKGKILHGTEEIVGKGKNTLKSMGVNSISELPDGNALINQNISHNAKNNLLKNLPNLEYHKFENVRSYYDPYQKGTWMCCDKLNSYEIKFLDSSGKETSIFQQNNKGNYRFQSLAVFQNFPPMMSFSNGIFWLNPRKKSIEKINSLPDENTFFINKISENRIAISFLNGDMILAKINPDKSVTILQKILPNVQSFYLQEDEKTHQFWVGTNQGVFLLDQNFKYLKKFDSNNGLAGTYIYGILIDNDGNAWCSHQKGMSSIDKKTYRIANFDKEDGIQHWDFNNRAFCKTSDGTLYFGGVNGFNFIKPPLKLDSHYLPAIYIDEILINSQRLSTEIGYNQIKKLHLKTNENNLIIKAYIKDLEFGKQRKLYYKITNQENRWIEILPKQSLRFNSLEAGDYTIEFAMYDKYSGVFSNFKKLEISISKAFYKNIFFWLLVGSLFLSAIIGLYGRYSYLKQQAFFRQKLALEEQRNKITADLHDDLGATLSSLQINSMIASKLMKKNPEETYKILEKIESQSHKISENMGDIVWSLKPGKDEFMSMSTRIRNFANEILGNSNINYHIEIDESINTEITDFTVRKNIVLITKEALNNAAKYSKATEINIIIKKIQNNYLVEISDNGIGFQNQPQKGHGLENMKKRALEIHGNFEITAINGTQIKILIPNIRDNK